MISRDICHRERKDMHQMRTTPTSSLPLRGRGREGVLFDVSVTSVFSVDERLSCFNC
jgi:hypothetical protein